ncbi:8654_t:CDS:2 [Entrophospora sp. SA101]|nr:8654_t:CDS:2 [Entrophospora sp. SA101]
MPNYILLGNNWFCTKKYDNKLPTYLLEIVIDAEDAWVRITPCIKNYEDKGSWVIVSVNKISESDSSDSDSSNSSSSRWLRYFIHIFIVNNNNNIIRKQQLTPVSIESFKKELDLKLVTIIAELEKGNDCLNDILDALIVIPVAIIDVKEALMDIIKASIDNNARFKELENDDREYDESYQENKERLLEYEERL